ncbi:MAG: hypothetical protein Aurels2KO_40370 [Aureliella sp.]
MNMNVILVVCAVCFLVPASLAMAFAVSRDDRTYVKHYDARGYSIEACNSHARKVANANSIMVSEEAAKLREQTELDQKRFTAM